MQDMRQDMPGEADVGARTAGGIGTEDVREAIVTLRKYKSGRAALERRIVENEKWYRVEHWDLEQRQKNGSPEPASAWLFNALSNKHADAMDNYPSPAVLPREQSDEQDAQILSSVLPTVLEQAEYERTYDRVWWQKLRSGTGVQGVFWDPTLLRGTGDIAIRAIDLLNLYWEPGISDIQQSQNVFHVEIADVDALKSSYPYVLGGDDGANIGGENGILARYWHDDTLDMSGKAVVVDWYYKVADATGQKRLHYCKFVDEIILYASENDAQYAARGYYDHGEYPFVFDTLFPIEGSPAGFGYVDIGRSPQIYIDKLDQALLANTLAGAYPRWFSKGDGMINEEEYADFTKPFVHFTGSGNPQDSIFPIQVPNLNPYAITMRSNKVEELKETSGNRDFSQGSTANGVTAASAIAALQEAGSKLSRDMIKGGYRAFAKVCYMCIELMRQFYTIPRTFRIVGQNGGMQFVGFSGAQIGLKQSGDNFMSATRLPVFDIKVVAQKSSPFSTVAQNERAKELFGLGFFNPSIADQALLALDMMQFEGIEKVREKVSQNSMLVKFVQQMAPMLLQMAQELDALKGTQYAAQIAVMIQQMIPGMDTTMMQMGGGGEVQTNSLGDALNGASKTTSGEARKQAASNSTPR